MSINPGAQAQTSVSNIDGSITAYYDLIDEALRPSENAPGKYNTITAPSYMNQCPCNQGSFTSFDISVNDPEIVLLEKSFVLCHVEFDIVCDVAHTCKGNTLDTNPQVYFIGWRTGIDTMYKYNVKFNGREMVTQEYAGEESYIVQSVMKDDVKSKRPGQYTTYHNASSLDKDVCGTYIQLQNVAAGTKIHVSVPVKISLSQFPFFKDFIYLPGWMGHWSVQMFPDSRNIIMCPVDPRYTLGEFKYRNVTTDGWSHEFTQIGHTFKGIIGYDGTNIQSNDVTFSIVNNGYRYQTCESNITSQVLRYDSYDNIKAKYIQKPCIIPFLRFVQGRFSGAMGKDSATSCVYSGMIRNCECMFALPFIDDTYHTICKNPHFQGAFLNIGGFGNYPQNPIDTFDSADSMSYARFLNMTQDALNVESSPLVALNEDVSNSLHGNTFPINTYGDKGQISLIHHKYKSDATNFLMGFPFADDDDFQGGLTSQGNTNIKFQASSATAFTEVPSIGITGIFVCDQGVMIKPSPVSNGIPEVVVVEEKFR